MRNPEETIKRLNRIGIALTSQVRLDNLMEMIVTEARSFADSDAGSLFTVDQGKLIFRVAQTESLEKKSGRKPSFKAFPLPLSRKSVAGYVALTGQPINVDDCYDLDSPEGPVVDRSYDQRVGYRSKSMLAVPMRDEKGVIIGVIQLINAMDEDGNIVSFTDDVQELIQSIASQAAVAIKNARLISDIKNLFASFVKFSATAIDERSPHTAGHTRRVAGMSMRLANAINEAGEGPFAEVVFSDEELEELWFAAWLHDIGKIAVKETVLEKNARLNPDRLNWIITRMKFHTRNKELLRLIDSRCEDMDTVLEEMKEEEMECESEVEFLSQLNTSGFLSDEAEAKLKNIAAKNIIDCDDGQRPFLDEFEYKNLSIKRGNLTQEEWVEMRSHVVKTRSIVNNIPFTEELANVPRYAAGHHEMVDGSGYPDGIKDEQLPLQARILAVADVYDALTAADRPYKKAIPHEKSISILQEEAVKGRLDSRIVELLISEELYEGHKEDQAEYPWKREVF
ncbi:GAF domain-containing protein [bacterium]|nr:GAF domain-containing protein [bacterium]